MKRYLSTKPALIYLTASEKTGFMDDGRTTDACMTTVALLCSSTKQRKKMACNLKTAHRRVKGTLGVYVECTY